MQSYFYSLFFRLASTARAKNMSERRTLSIGVIGSGIAGLAAGIALRCAGHDVTIYERSNFKHEIGAAITFCPNSNKILNDWGFNRTACGSTPKQQIRRMKWDTLDVLYHQSYDNVLEKYGYPFDAFHREDIHHELRTLAEKHGARIVLGKQAVYVDCADGRIDFEDGEKVKADLIVIADGIRVSRVGHTFEQCSP